MIPLYLIKVLCIVGIHKHVRPWLAFGVHAALSLKHKRSRPTTFGVWAERQAQRERNVVGEGNGEMKRSRGSKQRHLRRTHTHTHTHTCAQTQTQTQTQTHTHTDTQTHTCTYALMHPSSQAQGQALHVSSAELIGTHR